MATKPEEVTFPKVYTPEDVEKLVGCKYSKACSLIRKWNAELKAKGYETMRGRCPARYVHKKLYL